MRGKQFSIKILSSIILNPINIYKNNKRYMEFRARVIRLEKYSYAGKSVCAHPARITIVGKKEKKKR